MAADRVMKYENIYGRITRTLIRNTIMFKNKF